ncbi:MAG: type II secretion system F family protein [Candidatus Diapherotrites archaeon]|nr:type II secretion system F family protein [Candidatus Diapherotrites archaeon]
MGLYQRIASMLPESIINAFRRELAYVGISVEEKRFVGFLILFSLAVAATAAMYFYLFFNVPVIATFGLVFLICCGGTYFWIDQMAEGSGRKIDVVLPDVLELIASNIKAGLTTERAIFTSARPEFGLLSTELKEASKEIMSGERVDSALMGVPARIKSIALERTIWLLVQGIKSGGQIADLLMQLGSDQREENAIKDEIKADISMYILLIFFAAAFGAPLLFGISSVIVGILAQQTASISINPEQMQQYSQMSSIGRFFGVPTVGITEEFVAFYAAIALVVTSVFASFTIGAINAGSEKRGMKFIPIILGISLLLFYMVRIVLGGLLGNISSFV